MFTSSDKLSPWETTPLSQYSQPIWYFDIYLIEILQRKLKKKNLLYLGKLRPKTVFQYFYLVCLLFCLFAPLVQLASYQLLSMGGGRFSLRSILQWRVMVTVSQTQGIVWVSAS